MNTTGRYVILVVLVLIGLHSLLSFTHEDYGRATSLGALKDRIGGGGSHVGSPLPDAGAAAPVVAAPAGDLGLDEFDLGVVPTDGSAPPEPFPPLGLSGRRANATLLMLARNSDLDNAVRSVRRLEDRFNRHFNYPWTFLNDVDFDENFKRRISVLTKAPVHYGVIPKEHWVQADWVDEDKASAERQKMVEENVIYGGSLPYRNMCRFNSGFFFKHPLLQQYRWYWRVEPDVHFHCDIAFDPFLYMDDHNKTYGFTISLYEFERTIPTLWQATKDFIKQNPQHVASNNAMSFLSDNGGETYNLCHFWSNFEIADMDFWRSPAYQAYFAHLEAQGGFYYERWGDAPVHSIAAALFLPKEKIHLFDEIGYEHNPYTHCPRSEQAWTRGKCACDRARSFDYDGYSCMRKWDAATGRPSQ